MTEHTKFLIKIGSIVIPLVLILELNLFAILRLFIGIFNEYRKKDYKELRNSVIILTIHTTVLIIGMIILFKRLRMMNPATTIF